MTDIDESELLEEIEEMPKPKLMKSKMVKPKDDTKGRFGNVVSDNDDDDSDDSRMGAKPHIEKPKPPRTPKQIEAFKKVRDKKMENAKMRQDEKKTQEEADKKELEAKIIKKAVALKKKQIKKQVVLEEISDDETPIEVIKQMKKSLPKPIEKPRAKFIFV